MKLLNTIAVGLATLSPAIVAQELLPRPALEGATGVANGMTTYFNGLDGITSALTISNNLASQLDKFNNYMTNTVYPSVNPQRFMPNGQLRARTCDERKAIFQAYKNLFNALIKARQAAQAAVCRVELKVPGLTGDVRVDPLSPRARTALDTIESRIRRLWDQTANQYDSFDFYVFGCKPRFDATCQYKFVNGKNPNKDQCFPNQAMVEAVGSVTGLSSSATFGWVNIKDCQYCATGNTLPTCISLPL
ncbi:hypothetical protein H072_11422 [Dactylellina haptotyla CBS 200.50]|uniref:Uncharacterized protein n=1 Tax=Dactylellina haptotyla (strain CBS 200.50) TaxID=1284197 RepID=S8B876_DACHA|nr:hypothetical protein H072_11422 [Dactylellina haptotyla CBS 200.50]